MIYPLVTWIASWSAFTVDVTVGAVTETLSMADGTGYGWLTTGTESSGYRSATSTSLAYAFAALLDTHSAIALNGGAYYGVTDFGAVQAGSGTVGWGVRMTLTGGSFATIAATSSAAALALFGLKVGDALEGGTTLAKITAVNRRTAGVWRPKFAPPAQLEPVSLAVGSGAMSEYSPATQDRLFFSGRLIWSVLWEYVEAADISRQLLNIADYLPLALRATGDTAGTLDDLLFALARGAIVKLALPPIGTAAVKYVDAVVDNPGSFDRGAYTTEAAVGARRYNVSMALTATDDFDPDVV